MKWQRGSPTDDVEDRRGTRVSRRGAAIGGGSAVVVVVIVLIAKALGVDLSGLVGGDSGGGAGGGAPPPAEQRTGQPSTTAERPPGDQGIDPTSDPDFELKDFITFVLNDVQRTFAEQIGAQRPWNHDAYVRAKLVIFTELVDSGCGQSSSAIGPFYCPPDQKAYIDLSFYRELKQRFGAPGDFAQAYVLAHELGHHLQTLFGIDEDVQRRATRKTRNDLSVRQELQADCFAGVWAHYAKQRDLLEIGDVKEALDAASAIGDDRLAKMAGQQVNPETWTHGSSAMRVKWFQSGFSTGAFVACDTFASKTL